MSWRRKDGQHRRALSHPRESVVDRKEACLSPGKRCATARHSQMSRSLNHSVKYLLAICGKQAFCQALEGIPHEKVGRSKSQMAVVNGGREQEIVAVPRVFTVHN